MLSTFRQISNLKYKVAATLAVATMAPTSAFADGGGGEGTVGNIAKGLVTQIGEVGRAVLAGGAVVGIILMISGLVKLKQAAETQGQQVKYSEGLWRCVVGAGLIAIPALNGVLGQSIGIGGDAVQLSPGGDAAF